MHGSAIYLRSPIPRSAGEYSSVKGTSNLIFIHSDVILTVMFEQHVYVLSHCSQGNHALTRHDFKKNSESPSKLYVEIAARASSFPPNRPPS